MKDIMIVVGTRPEIIKMAPLVKALQQSEIPFTFVHCGQHYDYEMSQQFIEELELPKPDYSFKVKAYSQGHQTARIIANMERLLKKAKPALVLVEGDTNGVLATSLASVKLGIPVGHVEAGLRSFDLRMPITKSPTSGHSCFLKAISSPFSLKNRNNLPLNDGFPT
jgi:UDP-N-acetylglucosamine 2-epimerase (non-hydrolysing)